MTQPSLDHGTARRRPFVVAKVMMSTIVAAALAVSGAGLPAVADEPRSIPITDQLATGETRSLFAYLDDTRGDGILFGQQHVLDNGITFGGSPGDGTKSDVFAGTGDYPAVFGWDTLILEGRESPGSASFTPAQNLAAFRSGLQQAHRLGGINTISAHMKNFVTGNDFTDASGRVISHILPGGDKNADFRAYLDQVAELANTTVDDNGALIPMIFRPFHENTGSWFWWGAAWASPGEYKEIFRYTVEYLRDTRGVHNLLYAFSPNGSFGADPNRYLATYPGDAWVDILGYDSYENDNTPANSDAWLAQLVPDLGMVADLADARGKISALTEFGRNGDRTIKPSGNKSLEYFTDTLAAIKADPRASRAAYMLTWANFGGGQIYVPYPAFADQPQHEMFSNFLTYYQDPFTVFAGDMPGDLWSRAAVPSPAEASVRFVSPADGQRVVSPSTTVRTKVAGADAQSVSFTVGDDPTEHALTVDAEGFFSGQWEIGEAALTNQTVTITVTATTAVGPLSATASVILGAPPVLGVGTVDDFEGYGDDAALRAAYTVNNGPADSIALSTDVKGGGEKGVRFAYEFNGDGGYRGFGRSFSAADWSGFNRMNLWLAPDGSNQKLVVQLKAGGFTFEAYPSLASTDAGTVSIPFSEFRPPSWDAANVDKRLNTTLMASVSEVFIYINQVGAPSSGAIVLDDIRAIAGDGPPLPGGDPVDPPDTGPVSVDDFESYADDAAVRATWSGRDNEDDLALTAAPVGSGTQAAAFNYDFSTLTYAGISRTLSSDWSANDRVSLWVDSDGSGQQLVVQFKAGGISWEGYVTLDSTTPAEVSVLFADAVPASYQNLDPAMRPTSAQLADVSEFALFVTKQAEANTGVVVLDDIRADTATVEPVPDPVSSTIKASVTPLLAFSWQRPVVRAKVSSSGPDTPTGTVTIRVAGREYAAPVTATASVKFTLPKLPRGLHRVAVHYSGDVNTLPSDARTWVLVLF